MKKFTKQMLLLIATLVSFWASGQNLIGPITINLPTNPPANTADWATTLPPVMILAQTNLVNGQVNGAVQESKILVTIKKAGTKVCGTYTPQTAPMAGFNTTTKNWSGANVLTLLGQECTLQPGSYELCVQFYGYNGATAGTRLLGEKCKAFTIAEKAIEKFSPPINITPVKDKKFTEKEMNPPLTFRWTPLVPRPKETVTYRLKVWQLMQGQSGIQAMRTNQPIVTKDVDNITQATITNIYTGPCKPPYLCEYLWNVEAVDRQGEMLGSSEPTAFMVAQNDIDTQIDSLKIGCCENGKQSIQIKIKNNLTNANTTVKKVWIMGVNGYTGTPYPLDISATLSPILPYNFLPSSGSKVFIGSINCIENMNTVIVKTETERIISGLSVIDQDLAYDTLNCRCNLCDSNVVRWTLPTLINYNSNPTNNIATLTGPLSFGPYPIVKLSTEIVDFYWYTEGDCKKCNTNDYYFGNLTSGSIGGMLGGTSVAGPGGTPIPTSHQLDFISPTLSGVTINNLFNLNISLPPQTQLSCCTDCFRFCIRYTATFMQNGVCKTCSIVKCYETKRKHKQTEYGLQINQCGERIEKDLPNGGIFLDK